MQRRKYLTLIGLAGVTALAGCSESESTTTPDTEGGGDTATDAPTSEADQPTSEMDSGSGTEDDVATEQVTETEAETEEETATESESGGSAAFGPQTFEGSGTQTSDTIRLQPGPITAEFTHDGESNFITSLVTLEGESYEDVSLTNLIGSVEGSTVGAVSASGGHNLNVDADGEWSITLEQPGEVSTESLPIDASGDGLTYIGPFEFSGATEFQGSHEGDSNFIVEPIPVDPSNIGVSVFNEIGQFEGSTTARLDGVFYLNVDANGPWTLSTN